MASWFDIKGTTQDFFSIGIKKTKFDATSVLALRTFKLPNASVDMTGGTTGQVLGIISGTSIGWISVTADITGAASTVVTANLTANRAVISNGSGKIDVSTVTSTELSYLSGVTSAIQTQLSGKEPTITGAASTITSSNLTINRAVISNGSGKIDVSSVTSTELGYLSGVTSAIQTQLSGKEPTITTLPISKGGTNSSTALNNNRIIQSSSGAIVEAAAITSARALISDANGIPTHSTITSTELGYLTGVTSAIQTQLNGKQGTITGAATTIVSSDLTISRALISNASGKVDVSTVTSTELGYVSGVTSSIQTQLSGKEPTITTLPISKGGTNSSTALNNNRIIQSSSGAIVEAAAITSARALISDANGIPTHSTVTSTELGYVSGVTSSIQTQINGKEPTITTLPISKGGTNSSTALNNNRIIRSTTGAIVEAAAITAARALISDADGIPTHSTVTSTELGYVSGVTSSIQTQLNDLGQVTKVAGETLATNDYVYISSGTGNDVGRTAGRVYKVDPNFDDRVDGLGFVVSGNTAGNNVVVKFSGKMSGFSSLSAGFIYYASTTTPGLITTTPPSTSGQWIVVPAIAASTTEIIINSAASASAVLYSDGQTSFTLTNNQSSAASITGLIFDPIGTKAFFLDYFIYRSTGSSGVAQSGQLRGVYNSFTSTWLMSDDYSGENAGITFSILSSGQIQYTSTNIVGSTSTLKYAPRKTFS